MTMGLVIADGGTAMMREGKIQLWVAGAEGNYGKIGTISTYEFNLKTGNS